MRTNECCRKFECFNSRTRKGCDAHLPTHTPKGRVSIHAPARGAISVGNTSLRNRCFNSRTRKGCDIRYFLHLDNPEFQFTHPQGVRSTNEWTTRPTFCFNSRTRKGCDPGRGWSVTKGRFQFTHPQGVRWTIKKIPYHGKVSIHAPARGAIQFFHYIFVFACFNSRTRKGCDIMPKNRGFFL